MITLTHLKYFKISEIGGKITQDQGWMPNNPRTNAGQLFSTDIKPRWWSDKYEEGEGSAGIGQLLSWNCCETDKVSEVIKLYEFKVGTEAKITTYSR
jgi:hypothetical protein